MKQSAGILVYRKKGSGVEVLLAHPGGPFWAKKDVWSIPKGELGDGEEALAAARREFEEELGVLPPHGDVIELGTTKQPGKINHIWAVEGDLDISKFQFGSLVKLQWPPRSGEYIEFPENDKAAWFDLAKAKTKLFKAQVDFIDRLVEKLGLTISEIDNKPPDQQTLL